MPTVYVLFHETNAGHREESGSYVQAVYATQETAESERLRYIREAIEEGKDVYWNPDTEKETLDWTDDWRVEVHQVVG